MFDNYPDIMTPRQAADALHIGMNSIYRLLQTRELGHKRLGHKYIIPKSCLFQYVDSAQQSVNRL